MKDADLSGTWYPSNPQLLSQEITNYLGKIPISDAHNILRSKGKIIAVISPHAGLNYSGEIAAYGFRAIQNQRKQIETVIVVGFSHRKDYDGIAVFDKDGFKTPLGILYTDKKLAEEIISYNKKIFADSSTFENENSIELILPFIQRIGGTKILLLAIGRQNWENIKLLGDALYHILKDKPYRTIIASSDMSHYLPYNLTNETDTSTVQLISKMQPEELFNQSYGQNRMCGLAAVTAVMIAAKKLSANEAVILKQANSGDTTGEKNRVVGYLSAAFVNLVRETWSASLYSPPPRNPNGKSEQAVGVVFSNEVKNDEKTENVKETENALNEEQKKQLLKLARDTITLYLKEGKVLQPKISDPLLKETQGVFVTLRKQGELRGCIGNIIGTKPLYLGVRDTAISSAATDQRFTLVTKDELADITIEISVLSPLQKVTSPDEIILGKHGILVKDTFRSGVYLPQVADETGWSKEQFLASLCRHKAGMAADAWKTGKCEMSIFTAEVFEKE